NHFRFRFNRYLSNVLNRDQGRPFFTRSSFGLRNPFFLLFFFFLHFQLKMPDLSRSISHLSSGNIYSQSGKILFHLCFSTSSLWNYWFILLIMCSITRVTTNSGYMGNSDHCVEPRGPPNTWL